MKCKSCKEKLSIWGWISVGYCKRCEDRFKKYLKECDAKWQKERRKVKG